MTRLVFVGPALVGLVLVGLVSGCLPIASPGMELAFSGGAAIGAVRRGLPDDVVATGNLDVVWNPGMYLGCQRDVDFSLGMRIHLLEQTGPHQPVAHVGGLVTAGAFLLREDGFRSDLRVDFSVLEGQVPALFGAGMTLGFEFFDWDQGCWGGNCRFQHWRPGNSNFVGNRFGEFGIRVELSARYFFADGVSYATVTGGLSFRFPAAIGALLEDRVSPSRRNRIHRLTQRRSFRCGRGAHSESSEPTRFVCEWSRGEDSFEAPTEALAERVCTTEAGEGCRCIPQRISSAYLCEWSEGSERYQSESAGHAEQTCTELVGEPCECSPPSSVSQ